MEQVVALLLGVVLGELPDQGTHVKAFAVGEDRGRADPIRRGPCHRSGMNRRSWLRSRRGLSRCATRRVQPLRVDITSVRRQALERRDQTHDCSCEQHLGRIRLDHDCQEFYNSVQLEASVRPTSLLPRAATVLLRERTMRHRRTEFTAHRNPVVEWIPGTEGVYASAVEEAPHGAEASLATRAVVGLLDPCHDCQP